DRRHLRAGRGAPGAGGPGLPGALPQPRRPGRAVRRRRAVAGRLRGDGAARPAEAARALPRRPGAAVIGYAALAGALCGFGGWVAGTGRRPRPEPLAAALARFEPRPGEPDRQEAMSWDNRLGALALRHVPALGRVIERARADLRIAG